MHVHIHVHIRIHIHILIHVHVHIHIHILQRNATHCSKLQHTATHRHSNSVDISSVYCTSLSASSANHWALLRKLTSGTIVVRLLRHCTATHCNAHCNTHCSTRFASFVSIYSYPLSFSHVLLYAITLWYAYECVYLHVYGMTQTHTHDYTTSHLR